MILRMKVIIVFYTHKDSANKRNNKIFLKENDVVLDMVV